MASAHARHAKAWFTQAESDARTATAHESSTDRANPGAEPLGG